MTVSVLELPGGLQVPYVDVRGAVDGPHLTVLAGVHGTEYTSIAAVREFALGLDPAQVTGRITAVPLVNPSAFWARSPFVVPEDGKNLNRCFPGDPAGTAAQVLADRLLQTFVVGLRRPARPARGRPAGGARALLDLRGVAGGGGRPRPGTGVRARARGTPAGRAAHRGRQHLRGRGRPRHPGGHRGVGSERARRPGRGRLAPGRAHQRRPLARGPAGGGRPPAAGAGARGLALAAHPSAGWWEPAVAVGTDVAAGALLGTVSELLGGVVHEARAPESGVPLFLTTSPAVVADGLLLGLARAAR